MKVSIDSFFNGGDIVNAQADVVLCSIHRRKNLATGILSKQFLGKCGVEIQEEINEKCHGELKHGQIVTTSSGALMNVSQIMFICWYRYKEGNEFDLQNALIKCFEKAEELGHKTIAIPSIGTGGLRYPYRKVGVSMLKAIALFKEMRPNTTVSEISFYFREEDAKAASVIFEVFCPDIFPTSSPEISKGSAVKRHPSKMKNESSTSCNCCKSHTSGVGGFPLLSHQVGPVTLGLSGKPIWSLDGTVGMQASFTIKAPIISKILDFCRRFMNN